MRSRSSLESRSLLSPGRNRSVPLSYVGCNPGSQLGWPQHYRLVFEAGKLDYILADQLMLIEMKACYDRIEQSGLAVPAHPFPAQAGDKAMTVDVAIRQAARTLTVAELAQVVDALTWATALVSVEKIDSATAADVASRADAMRKADQDNRDRNPFNKFGEFASSLKWILIAVLLVAVLYFATTIVRTVKGK